MSCVRLAARVNFCQRLRHVTSTPSQDKELREIRTLVLDKETELDTLRKAGKNLRERLDEKEVETRGIMDRVRARL